MTSRARERAKERAERKGFMRGLDSACFAAALRIPDGHESARDAVRHRDQGGEMTQPTFQGGDDAGFVCQKCKAKVSTVALRNGYCFPCDDEELRAAPVSQAQGGAKWCEFCKANTHNDSECWSTRPANWRPQNHGPIGIVLPDGRPAAPLASAVPLGPDAWNHRNCPDEDGRCQHGMDECPALSPLTAQDVDDICAALARVGMNDNLIRRIRAQFR